MQIAKQMYFNVLQHQGRSPPRMCADQSLQWGKKLKKSKPMNNSFVHTSKEEKRKEKINNELDQADLNGNQVVL